MATFFGIFISVFAFCWVIVNIARSYWADGADAVEGITWMGIFTGLGTALTLRKAKKMTGKLDPKVGRLRKAVDSLRSGTNRERK